MANSPPLTKFIGEAERTLQALLQNQLQKAGLSFGEWVALTFLSGGGAYTATSLAEALVAARVVAPGDVVEGLFAKALIEGEGSLALTEAGTALFGPLRGAVRGITNGLVANMPQDDLVATQRVLETITQRAALMLDGAVAAQR